MKKYNYESSSLILNDYFDVLVLQVCSYSNFSSVNFKDSPYKYQYTSLASHPDSSLHSTDRFQYRHAKEGSGVSDTESDQCCGMESG